MGKISAFVLIFVLGLACGYYLWALNGVGEIGHAMGKPIPPPPPLESSLTRSEEVSLSESAISRGIIGKWQSSDDPEFTREFSIDATVTDVFKGNSSETFEGRWAVFTSPAGEKPPFPIAIGITYLRISMPEEVLYFKVAELTPTTLVLEYLDSGERLTFTR